MTDERIHKFVDNLRLQNENTAETVGYFLKDLEAFATAHLKTTVSDLIYKLKHGTWNEQPKEEQPYELAQMYSAWLKKNRLDVGKNSASTVRLKLDWARTLFEDNYININRRLWRSKVKSEKPAEPEMTPATKKALIEVLMATDNIRLRSLCMYVGSMGWRITDTLTLTLANFNIDLKTLKFVDVPYVQKSGKHSKTKASKRRRLTTEMAKQIEKLLAYRYRERTIKRQPKGKGTKVISVTSKPTPKATDRVFTPFHCEEENYKIPQTTNAHLRDEYDYHHASSLLRQTVDRLGLGFEEDGKRRKITFHTFRRFCYRTCTNIIHEQYAKYHTGRKVHEYAGKPDEEIEADFTAVEPFLTFMDTSAIEIEQKAILATLKDMKKNQAATDAMVHALVDELYEKDPNNPMFANSPRKQEPVDELLKDATT